MPAAAIPGEPALRVGYYGDCMFRAMDHSHGVHTPVGWPRVLAERLLERGERIEFSVVSMTEFDHLPGRAELGQSPGRLATVAGHGSSVDAG